jgi:glycosyltransferase involved in cell wall biosynthesis
MKILWLTWKDRSHPLAGGAETVSGEIMDRLARDGNSIKMITARYNNSLAEETAKGVEIYRVGNRYTVYLKAKQLYKKELKGWADLVVDEMNTIPFGSGFYNHTQNILLCYQLAREVWFYQMPFPLSLFGYLIEPLMLHRLSNNYQTVVTESQSTKTDLAKHGFKNINIFHVGMGLKPVNTLREKKNISMILSLGAIRPMKRTLDAIRAFEIARTKNNDLKMVIAGDNSGKYAKKVIDYVARSKHSRAIDIVGRVSNSQKLKLMQEAGLIIVTSVKEGWGLIVTEANSQGTPAIVYDADGLRDSVQDGITGLLSPTSDYRLMGDKIVGILSDRGKYELLRTTAWNWSKKFTFENSYSEFLKAIKIQ